MPQQTEAQRQAALQAAGVPAASLPSAISVSNLTTPQAPMNVQQSAPVPIPPIGQQTATAPLEPKPSSPFLDNLEGLKSQLAGKATDTAATKASFTAVPEQRLNDINTRLALHQAEALKRQEAALKAGETMGFASREAQNIMRTDAIEEMKLLALQAGAQGDIARAEKNAQTAIDTKYAQVEKDLETAKTNIYNNFDTFTKAEKKRAELTLLRIDAEDAFVKQLKAEETQKFNLATSALQNGATNEQATQILNQDSFEDALKVGGSFLGAQFRLQQEQAAFDRGVKTRQLQIQEAQLGLQQRLQNLELAKLGDPQAIKTLGYDPNNLPLTSKQLQTFETQRTQMEQDIETVKRAMTNTAGLKNSSGVFRSASAATFINPFRGGALGIPAAMSKKNDFLADANYIMKNLTFNKIKDLTDQGVKLTPISEMEFKAMADASNVLVSAAKFDERGNFLGFKMSEQRVFEQFKLIEEHYQRGLDNLIADTTLNEAERKQIQNL